MTTTEGTSPGAPLATIPVDQMESYIAAGRAERWTQSLGDEVPVAALLDGDWERADDGTWVLHDGTWYVVWDDAESKDVYELAPLELAAVLTDFLVRLRTANDRVAQSDAESGAQLVGEGEAVSPAPGSPEP